MSKDKKKTQQKTDKKLDELQLQIDELSSALLRERADSENIRRRHSQEISELKNHVKADVVKDLLPVIDNFDRALSHVPKDLEGNDFVKGVQGIVKQFGSSLKNLGVERIKTVGEEFDPELHEAISMEDGEGDKEIVSEELQAGYKIDDYVIRHAMVKVTNGTVTES